jgi:hypothetical protein
MPRLWQSPCTAKNPCHAEIFINLRPMDAFALADQFPVIPLIRGGAKQSIWV